MVKGRKLLKWSCIFGTSDDAWWKSELTCFDLWLIFFSLYLQFIQSLNMFNLVLVFDIHTCTTLNFHPLFQRRSSLIFWEIGVVLVIRYSSSFDFLFGWKIKALFTWDFSFSEKVVNTYGDMNFKTMSEKNWTGAYFKRFDIKVSVLRCIGRQKTWQDSSNQCYWKFYSGLCYWTFYWKVPYDQYKKIHC